MARTLDDVLARRAGALFLNAAATSAAAPTAVRLMARELGCDDAWQERQLRDSPGSSFASVPPIKPEYSMTPFLAEFIGTALLVVFGNGVVANVVLAQTKGNNSGWIVITAGWAIGVFVGVFSAQSFSGAHLNPAVTLAMAQAGNLAWPKVGGYIVAQLLGAILGGSLVFLFYRAHFEATTDGNAKLACFATARTSVACPRPCSVRLSAPSSWSFPSS